MHTILRAAGPAWGCLHPPGVLLITLDEPGSGGARCLDGLPELFGDDEGDAPAPGTKGRSLRTGDHPREARRFDRGRRGPTRLGHSQETGSLWDSLGEVDFPDRWTVPPGRADPARGPVPLLAARSRPGPGAPRPALPAPSRCGVTPGAQPPAAHPPRLPRGRRAALRRLIHRPPCRPVLQARHLRPRRVHRPGLPHPPGYLPPPGPLHGPPQ